jgi:hypothetical protein
MIRFTIRDLPVVAVSARFGGRVKCGHGRRATCPVPVSYRVHRLTRRIAKRIISSGPPGGGPLHADHQLNWNTSYTSPH